ncbi:putative ribonuclease H-like domain-containing protein [Tanacetum coccineum]|uniref:Ribonuclease H-like domain-containing protein n=1 Tax=Tanacetum coccineum TaxID=301880 RepID=A0ABQ5DIL9_9ASTR
MCDKKNSVLFTDTECVVLSPDFKLLDENHVLLRVPRKDNMYNVDLKNIVPSGGLTCLFAKATLDESNLWHRRLGHINFKTINKLVKGNLVRGLPSKLFEINQTCVACQKGKQHRASCKFDGKADEGFFVGYSTNSKAFRVFNNRTRIVEENLHVKFSEETPNIAGNGPNWLFDIDTLTKSMNYEPVVAGNQSNSSEGTKACDDARKDRMEIVPGTDYILVPFFTQDPLFSSNSKDSLDVRFKLSGEEEKMDVEHLKNKNKDNVVDENIVYGCIGDQNMPNLEEIVYSDNDEEVGAEADLNNLAITMHVGPIPTTRCNRESTIKTFRIICLIEPTKVIQALQGLSWIEVMQEELLQFKLQQVWTLMDLPHGKRAISTKWVYRNKKDERGIVIRNKARIEAIRLFLAYASFKDFVLYQMDVKSAFLYGKIEKEVYVCQPLGFEDPEFPKKVYKVEKALYGLHQAPRACTPMETSKPLLKDAEAENVDVHLYRSMIGSLMYLTTSRPDIMFAVCACARFQVTSKVSHLHAVKRIFRYLKGQPKLGIWYPKDSPFDLEAYTDSDYAGASLDRKSTTGGCQFLGRRLISWQCKKQTIVANSTTEAEYVAASSCCGQVLWIQNQMLDYGYNFMNTKIFIGNESTICIVKNPVFHSKTKHIEIRHHFIRDSNEKRLIQMIKIHTDHNVVDLLIKAFDVSRFQYLIATAKDEIHVSVIRMTYYWKAKRTTKISQSSGPIPFVSNETVIKEWEDRMERVATTASSLEAEQDSGAKIPYWGGAEAQIRFEAASKQSNDPPFSRVNTLGSEEDNMKLKELIEFCTKLSIRALDL